MLTRVSPAVDLTDLHGRLDRLFGDLWGEGLMRPGSASSFVPALDAYETPEALIVKLEIPGVDPSIVDVSVEGGELVVAGEVISRVGRRAVTSVPELEAALAAGKDAGRVLLRVHDGRNARYVSLRTR